MSLIDYWRIWRGWSRSKKNRASHERWIFKKRQEGVCIDPSIIFKGSDLRDECLSFGAGCIFEEQVCLWIADDRESSPKLTLDKNVFIGRNTYLGIHHPITFGENTLVGAYCYIISANHRAECRNIPIRHQGFVGAPINIGSDVWIGTHVVILPGVTIGDGAIIGAGSVVNTSIPPYQIWAGVPAHYIKERL